MSMKNQMMLIERLQKASPENPLQQTSKSHFALKTKVSSLAPLRPLIRESAHELIRNLNIPKTPN